MFKVNLVSRGLILQLDLIDDVLRQVSVVGGGHHRSLANTTSHYTVPWDEFSQIHVERVVERSPTVAHVPVCHRPVRYFHQLILT